MKTHFKVTHSGNLFLGNKVINCAVLENGQRIITQTSIYKVFDKSRRGSQRNENTLIDEATGFQNDRQAQELQNLLVKFIGEDLLKWQKRFPNQYYKEMFRLHGWDYNPNSTKRPGYAGTFTLKYVYNLFPKKVMEIIKRENPRTISNNHLYRHHQFLSVDIGIPELDRHISKLLGVMALSDNIEDFEKNLKKAFALELERVETEKSES